MLRIKKFPGKTANACLQTQKLANQMIQSQSTQSQSTQSQSTQSQSSQKTQKKTQSSLTTTPLRTKRRWTFGLMFREFQITWAQCAASISENTGRTATMSGLDTTASTMILPLLFISRELTMIVLSSLMKMLITQTAVRMIQVPLSVHLTSLWDPQTQVLVSDLLLTPVLLQ